MYHCLLVIAIKTVLIDNVRTFFHIAVAGGIARCLDAYKPVIPVIRWIGMASLVPIGHQQSGMVLDAFVDIRKHAELLILPVIIVEIERATLCKPFAAGFDAEIVVIILGLLAHSPTAFQGHLGQGDTGRDAIETLLLDGCRCILLEKRLLGRC